MFKDYFSNVDGESKCDFTNELLERVRLLEQQKKKAITALLRNNLKPKKNPGNPAGEDFANS
ncbi:MAG: hypothetical protein FWG36_02335 [Oscillospiraceae bacterium]|nr:hypothetical protein [Oscillospiraceae bacterium]